jgi:4,5:9,10-diseco-3-hydroxy-5,9,17-trioxoandrosta-1(10),2-diene-4-oate hydrolase
MSSVETAAKETATRAVPEGKHASIGDGLSIHYHEEGSGEAVLFLHGSGPGASGYSNFKGNYPFFAKNGYRTILPDTLGFGYSSKPDGVDYGMDFVVGGLERFLKAIKVERCTVVSNSHGGAVAIKLAANRPDLVEKLVLMAPGGLEERETYMKMEGIRTMMKVFLGPEGATREGMRKVFSLQLHDPSLVTDELLEERLQIAATQPKRVLTSLQVPNLTPELARITAPVLGFWGTGDKFCPVSGAMTIATTCARAKVVLLSQCGHWVMVEHRDYFNRTCLDFLREG